MAGRWISVDFKELIGKIFEKIEVWEDEINFHTKEHTYTMCHRQSCCEEVYVEDICGDIKDLTNSPIIKAYESTDGDKYMKWTFYHIATAKGHVTIRWYGKSNGYYSVDVDVFRNDK